MPPCRCSCHWFDDWSVAQQWITQQNTTLFKTLTEWHDRQVLRYFDNSWRSQPSIIIISHQTCSSLIKFLGNLFVNRSLLLVLILSAGCLFFLRSLSLLLKFFHRIQVILAKPIVYLPKRGTRRAFDPAYPRPYDTMATAGGLRSASSRDTVVNWETVDPWADDRVCHHRT